MPIYMDVHIVPGVKARNVAEAHQQDLLHQEEYGCKCMTYWVDEQRETIFCLIDAPSKEAVSEMHNKAHGLIPNKVIEVQPNVVESFLGRIYDPEDAAVSDDGLKVFAEPSLRFLLVTTTTDPVLLKHNPGEEKSAELLSRQRAIIRKNILEFGGREVEHAGSGSIVSFVTAAKAVSCALAIQSEISPDEAGAIGFAMSINAGEPIAGSNNLFGDTIRFGRYMCGIAKDHCVTITSQVRDLVAKDLSADKKGCLQVLSPQDEEVLTSLFSCLEENWQQEEFDLENYCHSTAMSQSQLYRKTVALTGYSPNQLLKEFRLEKARGLMKKRQYSIAQITFDSGFTSPSYFTKCFKKKFGLLPNEYLDLLHQSDSN